MIPVKLKKVRSSLAHIALVFRARQRIQDHIGVKGTANGGATAVVTEGQVGVDNRYGDEFSVGQSIMDSGRRTAVC